LIVIDASVLVGFLLDQEAAVTLVTDALAGDASGVLHAPELIEPESLSALRGLERGGEITAEAASQAVADLTYARLVRHPHAPLRTRVWELRHNLSTYDATYLALSERLREPLLLTGDGGLVAAAGRSLGASSVRYLPQ
jgi:predicted nucleic acid-binding protein